MNERPRPKPPEPRRFRSLADAARVAEAELVEVERAIAALEGRNIENAEHLGGLRRDAEERRLALEQILTEGRERQARRRRLLPYKIAAAVVALGAMAAGGWAVTRATRGELAVRGAAIDAARAAATPFESRFTESRVVVGAGPFTISAQAGRCFVVVAAAAQGPARVRVERDTVIRDATTSAAFCACKDEEAKVTVSGSGSDLTAAVVLAAPAASVGGADVLMAVSPRPGVVFSEIVDRTCAEAAFDAWAAGNQPAKVPVDVEKLAPEERSFARGGLAPTGLGTDDGPFLLVPSASDVCLVAVNREGGLSLRMKGGDRPLAIKRGVLGACLKDSAGLSVWRDGPGRLAIFTGPRARIGGLLGLREAAQRTGLPASFWAPHEDLEGDARAALGSAGVGEGIVALTANRRAVFAFSTDSKAMLTTVDVGPNLVCRPSIEAGAAQALCIETRRGAFDGGAGGVPGFAKGPVPLWLALSDTADRAALERSLELMAFARRMSAEGFGLTSLVGATLTAQGADVTGRSGEKEIVAIVVSTTPPFVHTLSADKPWTLADPRPTQLTPGAPVKLKATPKYSGVSKREFVIWRR